MPSRPRRPAYARGDRSSAFRSRSPRPRPGRLRNPHGRSAEEGRSGPAQENLRPRRARGNGGRVHSRFGLPDRLQRLLEGPAGRRNRGPRLSVNGRIRFHGVSEWQVRVRPSVSRTTRTGGCQLDRPPPYRGGLASRGRHEPSRAGPRRRAETGSRQRARGTRRTPAGEGKIPRGTGGQAQSGRGEPERAPGGTRPPEGEARGPRGLFDPTAGRGLQRGLPIREDPRNRGTTRGEFQRRFEEGGVESQFRRATGVRAGAEGTHRGEGRSRDSIPRGFDADRETREGGEGIGRRPRERTGRGRSPGRRGRQDPPRDREPRGRSEPTFHFDGERAPRRVSSPSGRSLRGSSEGDGGREGRARPGTQVPSTEGDRAPRSRGASPGSRGAGRRTGP